MGQKKDTSNISHPFQPDRGTKTGIRCPSCGNDGMDGTITGHSAQFQLLRECLKTNPETGKPCGRKWSGGIGVQQADFSREPLRVGGEAEVDPYLPPEEQDLTPGFRNPNKNTSGNE